MDLTLCDRDSQYPFVPSFSGIEHLVFYWAYGHLKYSLTFQAPLIARYAWVRDFQVVSLKRMAWFSSFLLPYCCLEWRNMAGGPFTHLGQWDGLGHGRLQDNTTKWKKPGFLPLWMIDQLRSRQKSVRMNISNPHCRTIRPIAEYVSQVMFSNAGGAFLEIDHILGQSSCCAYLVMHMTSFDV